jgi:hypothetical protein
VGLLRRLAELIVEFPDTERPPDQGATAEDEDVVAAIERIRLDLEKSASPDFEETDAVGAPPAEAAPAEAGKASAAAAPAATDDPIRVPKALGVHEVYERARIAPTEGFDVYRVEQMLADPEIADLDVAMRARMVRLALKNMGLELADILADAGRRDQVLEDYLLFLQRRVAEIEQQVKEANAGIQREIDEIIRARTAVITENEAKLRKVLEALEEYRRSKQAEEERLFDIVSPFVEQGQNPVEIDG